MSFKAIKKVRLYEEIVNQIKDLIIKDQLKPRQPLPPERELAEKFGVSLVSVRQALVVLETIGLIKRKRGRGIYIVSEEVDFISDVNDEAFETLFLEGALVSRNNPITEVLEVRCLIEPPIAKCAAERATEENIADMEKYLLQQEKKIEAKEPTIQEDLCFHKAIAAAVNNSVLLKIIEDIYETIWEIKEKLLITEQACINSLKGHNTILEAIKNKDGRSAYRAMLIHLKEVEVSLMPFINKNKNMYKGL